MICEIYIYMCGKCFNNTYENAFFDFSYMISAETFEAAAPGSSNWQGLLQWVLTT